MPATPRWGKLRVAEVHFGEGRLTPAIETAGMTLAATIGGKRGLPPLDIALLDAPVSPIEWEGSVDYLNRFIRVRRPVAFIFLGCMGEELQWIASSETVPYGYEVGSSSQDEPALIAGVSEWEPDLIVWEALYEAERQTKEALGECLESPQRTGVEVVQNLPIYHGSSELEDENAIGP